MLPSAIWMHPTPCNRDRREISAYLALYQLSAKFIWRESFCIVWHQRILSAYSIIGVFYHRRRLSPASSITGVFYHQRIVHWRISSPAYFVTGVARHRHFSSPAFLVTGISRHRCVLSSAFSEIGVILLSSCSLPPEQHRSCFFLVSASSFLPILSSL